MEVASADAQAQAREKLDAHVRDMMAWHFDPETGTPFWLDFASKLDFDPRGGHRRVRRSAQVPALRGRVAARRPGAALGAEGDGR